ncbi:hypothetical protein N7539_004275 [Penicillium diatomitis]|uniref:tRNA ligase n=1 Tax=Penicillium diatomitis TaxID=2819901 RepID=A0A9X0BY35_9EURO|nr:uncharacterized protein N7539_004275 [Penicillium diatomitis]KAJ5489385.1 hypothetical protein N7539_004275 [Penicillium diatomitis]
MAMATQNPSEIRKLVQELEEARKMSKGARKQCFTCKKSTFAVAGTAGVTVDSWKFMDWDYKMPNLPIYARGLFTTERKDKTPEIAVRGYDKFFNIGEVKDTEWRNIENKTKGPYELSVKENGCIVFISGLEDDKLLVCSKHSTGHRSDSAKSHAQVGEEWVERCVSGLGKTTKDLARTLRQMNVTAVGELCDDSFEEHVLAYDQTAAGIYLHGLNYNQTEFATMSGDKVHEFADAWGFKKAKYVVYDDITAVRQFLESCAETGTWDGRETEGFVVRCQISDRDSGYRDWFFKYKFEEPYLMYRQWRECTKAVISGKLPKIKKHRGITEEYLNFARREFMKNPQLTEEYQHNHGIISLREKFLQERGLKGSEIIAMEEESNMAKEATKNVILAPIASLGCGKTTVALALVYLFGWGHLQNDNIPKQKGKPQKFAFEITKALATHPVVIADRNNHQRRERQQLMDDTFPVVPDAQFVALHYVHEPKSEFLPAIKEVTRKRVLERGDNHQTIRAGSKNQQEIVGIMDGFLTRFEGVHADRAPDMNFQHVIDLDVCSSSRENLETVVRALHSAYPRLVPNMPSAEELDKAIEAALTDYHVQEDLSKGYSAPKTKKQKNSIVPVMSQKGVQPKSPEALVQKSEYFGVSVPSSTITATLQSLFNNKSPELARFYHYLRESRRLQPAFHVTLIHRASSRDRAEIWDRYTKQFIRFLKSNPDHDLAISPPQLGRAQVRLERLIWDDKLMAFVVRLLPIEGETGEGVANADEGLPCANRVPHITVGTASQAVKPKESNDLLQRWLQVGSGGDTGIHELEVPNVLVVEGTIHPVMMRGK